MDQTSKTPGLTLILVSCSLQEISLILRGRSSHLIYLNLDPTISVPRCQFLSCGGNKPLERPKYARYGFFLSWCYSPQPNELFSNRKTKTPRGRPRIIFLRARLSYRTGCPRSSSVSYGLASWRNTKNEQKADLGLKCAFVVNLVYRRLDLRFSLIFVSLCGLSPLMHIPTGAFWTHLNTPHPRRGLDAVDNFMARPAPTAWLSWTLDLDTR